MDDLFNKIKEKYPNYDPSFNEDWEKPNINDLNKISNDFNCKYPTEFIDFQLKYCFEIPMGDFAWDGFGWANLQLEPYMNLYKIVKDARTIGVPDYLSPFKNDNSDYYCFDTRYEGFPVVIWDHNSQDIEKDSNFKWKNFIDWLENSFN